MGNARVSEKSRKVDGETQNPRNGIFFKKIRTKSFLNIGEIAFVNEKGKISFSNQENIKVGNLLRKHRGERIDQQEGLNVKRE